MVARGVGGGCVSIKEQQEVLGDGTALHPGCGIYRSVRTQGLGTKTSPIYCVIVLKYSTAGSAYAVSH